MQKTSHPSPNTRHGSQSDNAQALRGTANALLEQACELLEQIGGMKDSERIMTHESTLIPGSTIGKHLRHTHDHYRILLESVPSSASMAGPLSVNYDVRTRLVDMENDPKAALKAFTDIQGVLSRAMDKVSLDKQVDLVALTPQKQQLASSFGRELWFVALHAIHHFSLLRVIAAGELGMTLPANFGVAPSTLAFREAAKVSDSPKGAVTDRNAAEKLEHNAEKMASKVKL